jgi:hypothetical protein
MLELLLALLILSAITVGVYFLLRKKDKKTDERYGDVISHQYFQFQANLGDLIATKYNYRDEMVKGKLGDILANINPGEKVAVLSIDNNIGNRRGLESEEPVRQNLVPAVHSALKSRGLKVARNSWDGQVILKEYSGDYDYPIGYFIFVEKLDNI